MTYSIYLYVITLRDGKLETLTSTSHLLTFQPSGMETFPILSLRFVFYKSTLCSITEYETNVTGTLSFLWIEKVCRYLIVNFIYVTTLYAQAENDFYILNFECVFFTCA